MTTLAHTRLAALNEWFDRNSWADHPTPNGGTLAMGRFASIIPWAFDTPVIADTEPEQLLFYVNADECDGVALDGYDPHDRADSQRDAADRLEHCLFLWEDGKLPPCVIVGLSDALEPIADAVARAGVAGANLDALPVLATPLWLLADGPRGRLAARLPFIPRADAIDPAMPSDSGAH